MSNMATSEREIKIYTYLKEKKLASVDELAKLLYASSASIRRDLDKLQQQGIVKRTHGGAVFVEKTSETAVNVRLSENREKKERIAAVALKALPDYETVFIDDSSTALVLAESMDFTHKLVVTNGLELATLLAKRRDVEIILPGGTILYNTGMLSGSYTIERIREFKFDLTITSCTAIDGVHTYERSQDTAILKRTAAVSGAHNLLLFDADKLRRRAPHVAMSVDTFDTIVTDAKADDLPFYGKIRCKIFCGK